jgi:hypothetical protein
MNSIACALRIIHATFFWIASALLALTPVSAGAETDGCKFVGNVGYSYIGSAMALTADKVINLDASGVSGPLQMELWALTAPYTGSGSHGYKLAEYSLGQLPSGGSIPNVNSGPVAFLSPPNGTWIFTVFLTEAGGVVDYRNFAVVVIPQVGLWWNPQESGSGYALDYKHGVLVVTVYSYQQNGTPQWYLAAGSLPNTIFSATLDKYTSGQCISCVYTGRPALAGNDGTITIDFTSATTATVTLPGGRVTQIQPQAF